MEKFVAEYIEAFTIANPHVTHIPTVEKVGGWYTLTTHGFDVTKHRRKEIEAMTFRIKERIENNG